MTKFLFNIFVGSMNGIDIFLNSEPVQWSLNCILSIIGIAILGAIFFGMLLYGDVEGDTYVETDGYADVLHPADDAFHEARGTKDLALLGATMDKSYQNSLGKEINGKIRPVRYPKETQVDYGSYAAAKWLAENTNLMENSQDIPKSDKQRVNQNQSLPTSIPSKSCHYDSRLGIWVED